jgi:hypothetical protein
MLRSFWIYGWVPKAVANDIYKRKAKGKLRSNINITAEIGGV